jgi:DnaJ-class molecular chaperone
MTSHYDVLNVPNNADMLTIKQSYRKLSLKHHPDKCHNSHDLYVKINCAYEILSDPEKREKYNKEHNIWSGGGDITPSYGCNNSNSNSNNNNNNNSNSNNNVPAIPIPILKSLKIMMTDVVRALCIPLEIHRWYKTDDQHYTETETLYVNIPQGVDSGEIIIVRGKGNVMENMYFGDVKVVYR